jgi:hypothetical protein
LIKLSQDFDNLYSEKSKLDYEPKF